MFELQQGSVPTDCRKPVIAHDLPTGPPSACFIQVRVGSDPRDYFIPLVIAEAWGLSQNQILTPEQAIKVGKAVQKFRTKQLARRSGKTRRRLFYRPRLASIVAALGRLKIKHLG
ncbi:MAG TPA: hypothetical protein VJ302_18425 [Blastocatellia bacterium]|nr:hypothetical protein [Blastocatellia bacterium]